MAKPTTAATTQPAQPTNLMSYPQIEVSNRQMTQIEAEITKMEEEITEFKQKKSGWKK